jgi:DNA/RNA-binding domain of Phe-tRNA-synthetase-like protein
MRRLALVVFGLALSVAANASWRSLQIDGSTEEAFTQSVEQMQEALSPKRRMALDLSLQDLWVNGVLAAKAEQREYTSAEYFTKLDGLGYKDVVELADPSGVKGYRQAYNVINGDPVVPRPANNGLPEKFNNGFGPIPDLIGVVP